MPGLIPAHYVPGDPLLKPSEVATSLGLHRETIYLWMRKGIIRFVIVGQGEKRPRKRIRESEMRRHIREPQTAA